MLRDGGRGALGRVRARVAVGSLGQPVLHKGFGAGLGEGFRLCKQICTVNWWQKRARWREVWRVVSFVLVRGNSIRRGFGMMMKDVSVFSEIFFALS